MDAADQHIRGPQFEARFRAAAVRYARGRRIPGPSGATGGDRKGHALGAGRATNGAGGSGYADRHARFPPRPSHVTPVDKWFSGLVPMLPDESLIPKGAQASANGVGG